ncbi:MAG: MFS transporter [Piscinibacter sp.]|jgi:predicted MFS family arabinose efflux permease|uniref:MFS transporter n=1 Tax=Piscinibacter sp. TaxID=1903157 RepID=UPI0011D59AA7|nr:MAG: MFS transporter [Burkholderiaceae bacterium]
MPPGLSDRALVAFTLSASIASTIGGLPFNALPVMLGSLADSFALDPQAVGLMGSVCFAGYLAGTLVAPLWINRMNWRVLTAASATGTAASFALSAQVSGVTMLYAVWALIGFFASTMTSLGMRILSDLPNKVRAYGVRQGVELSVTAAVLFALPPLVIAGWKYPGAALALAGVVAVLGLSALWVPAHPLVPVEPGAGGSPARRALPARSWACMAVFFVFLAGNIALWAFLERIGTGLKIVAGEMGLVFAVLKLLGGAAAFFVAWIGERGGHRLPYWAVLAGIALGLGLLVSAQSFLPFALGAWIWEFAFTCGCVYQAAAIARSDPRGRAVMLVPAVFALGSMIGPGVAGQLAAGGSYGGVLGLAAACSVVPALAYTWWQPDGSGVQRRGARAGA